MLGLGGGFWGVFFFLFFFFFFFLFLFFIFFFFFFSSRRRHTRLQGDWSSDVCSSDLRRCSPHCSRSFSSQRAEHRRRPPGHRRHRLRRSPVGLSRSACRAIGASPSMVVKR